MLLIILISYELSHPVHRGAYCGPGTYDALARMFKVISQGILERVFTCHTDSFSISSQCVKSRFFLTYSCCFLFRRRTYIPSQNFFFLQRAGGAERSLMVYDLK